MARYFATSCLLGSLCIPLMVGIGGTAARAAETERAAGSSRRASVAHEAERTASEPALPVVDTKGWRSPPQRPLWSCPVPLKPDDPSPHPSPHPSAEPSPTPTARSAPGADASDQRSAAPGLPLTRPDGTRAAGAPEPGLRDDAPARPEAASSPRVTEPAAPTPDCPPFIGRWERRLPPPAASDEAGMGGVWDEEDEQESPICAEGDTRCSPTPPRRSSSVPPLYMVEGALNVPAWPHRIHYGLPAPPRVLGAASKGYPHPPFEPPRAAAAS